MGSGRDAWGCRRAVGEAERVLEGRCVDSYRQYGLSPPTWAVVNALAHGTASALTKRATCRWKWRSRPWEQVECRLAAELVVGADPDEILRLQRDALVPLELMLLNDPDACPATPGGLFDLVAEAVGRGRNGHAY